MTATLLTALGTALQKGREKRDKSTIRCDGQEEALLARCLENELHHDGLVAVLFMPGGTACSGPLFELPRRAARAGRHIERLYLLPEQELRADAALHHHVALDREAGIHVTVRDIGARIAAGEPPIAPLLNCSLWHNEDIGDLLLSGAGASGWTLSFRQEDIETRREIIADLGRSAAPLELNFEGASRAAVLHEPLLSSAPLAKMAAPVLCRRGSDEDCAWYHGYWQYFRILGIVAAPERHAGFYARALGESAASGDYRRILVSASADYAMLAHLLHAYGEAAGSLAITVLDICETPLMLRKWYARRQGLNIETQACDILHWNTEQCFDLIVTHSFLQMMPATARETLVAKWRQVLRPGGKIVSTIRLKPEWTEAHVLPDAEGVALFRENARREALKWQDVIGIEAQLLAEAAEKYVARLKNYSLRSEEELRALFTAAGFVFDRLDPVAVKGKVGHPQVGAGTSQSATYAEFVARRV